MHDVTSNSGITVGSVEAVIHEPKGVNVQAKSTGCCFLSTSIIAFFYSYCQEYVFPKLFPSNGCCTVICLHSCFSGSTVLAMKKKESLAIVVYTCIFFCQN
jgi:hypothetical protein